MSTSCPGDKGPGLSSHGVDSCSDDSCPGPRDRGFEPLCTTTPACVLVLAVSTSCPGRLAPGSEGLWVQPEVPGDSGPGPSARRVDQLSQGDSGPCPKSCRVDLLSWAYRAIVQGPRGRSDVPGDVAPSPRCRRVNQLSRITRARVGALKVSTSCPELLKSGPRACRVTSCPDGSHQCPSSRGFQQLSLAAHDPV